MAKTKTSMPSPRDRASEGIVSLIADQGYRGGEALPSERKLCAQLDVSRATLRSAVSILSSLGVVESRGGSGTYVCSNRPVEHIHAVQGYSDLIRSAGRTPGSRLIEQSLVNASKAVADQLAIEPGTPVLRLSRVRLIDGMPARIDTTHINTRVVPGIEEYDFARKALFDVLSSRYGITICHRSSRVTVKRADRLEAGLLDVEPGTPVFLFTDICMTSSMEAVEWSEMVVLPSSCLLTNVIEARKEPQIVTTTPSPLVPVTSSSPAYLQVRAQVLAHIIDGTYPAGAALPSEPQMAKDFAVTRKTVRKAVDALVDQGFIRRIRGKGTFSLGAREHGGNRPVGFREREALRHTNAQVRVLSSFLRPAGAHYANVFGIEEGDLLLCLRRLNISDGTPQTLETSYIPIEIFPGIESLDFSVLSLYETYARMGHAVASSSDTLGVVELSAREARLLQVSVEDPALLIATLNRDDEGTPIEYTLSLEAGRQAVYEIRA